MTSVVPTLLTVLGVLLLVAGVRLIGLVAAFTGGTIGWCVAGALQGTLAPDLSPALCAASAAVIGASLGALFVRPAVATGFAVFGVVVGLMLGVALVDRGVTGPTSAGGSQPTTAADSERPSQAIEHARIDLIGLARRTAQGAQRALGETSPISALALVGSQAWGELNQAWRRVPSASRTLLMAMAAGGAALGVGVVIVFSRWALAGASSAIGAALVLGCGLPLGSRLTGAYRPPETVGRWLLLMAVLTLSGWAFQMRRVQTRKEVPAQRANREG